MNYVIVEACLDSFDETAFFEQYQQELVQREDDILRYFAEKLAMPAHRIALAEAMREKDWNYWKIIGNSLIPGNWERSEAFLQNALQTAPADYHPLLWVLRAKNIVLNHLEDRYAEAESLCRQALEMQPRDHFYYSLQLLYRRRVG